MPLIETRFEDSFQKKAPTLFSVSDSLIFTSQTAVKYLFSWIKKEKILLSHQIIAIGKATSLAVEKEGFSCITAKEPTQEGVIDLLEKMSGTFFWPKSKKARKLLEIYLKERGSHFLDLYDTNHVKPKNLVDLEKVSSIFFTSPSTVEAFFAIYQKIPKHVMIYAIGPITQGYLLSKYRLRSILKSFENTAIGDHHDARSSNHL